MPMENYLQEVAKGRMLFYCNDVIITDTVRPVRISIGEINILRIEVETSNDDDEIQDAILEASLLAHAPEEFVISGVVSRMSKLIETKDFGSVLQITFEFMCMPSCGSIQTLEIECDFRSLKTAEHLLSTVTFHPR